MSGAPRRDRGLAAGLARQGYWRGLCPAAQRLPPERALPLAWHLSERLARPAPAIAGAIRRALPERASEAEALSTRARALQLRAHLERALFPNLRPRHLEGWARLEGLDGLRQDVARGRGVVLAATHFGAHGWPPVALHLAGLSPVVQTLMRPDAALPPDAAWSQSRRRALEDTLPVRYLRNPEDAALESALRRGEPVIVTADCRPAAEIRGEWRRAPLLGQAVAWPLQPFALAARTGAALWTYLPTSARTHRLQLRRLDGDDPQRSFILTYEAELCARPGQWQYWQGWEDLRAPPIRC